MSALQYLPCLLLAAAAAVAAPAPHPKPRSLELNAMINNTVCAIEVEYNKDPNRIPQTIKMLKCASQTDQGCEVNKIRHHDCCHHRHSTECVEMTDQVMVFNIANDAMETFDVSVGCACMIRHTTVALGVTTPYS